MTTQTINTKGQLRDMIMKRDHCTKQEATHRINVTQQLINETLEYAYSSQLDDIEDILAQHLGIELDYIYLFIM